AMACGILASGIVAALLDRLVLSHLYARPIVFAILSTLGFSIVLQSAMQLTWGNIPLVLRSIASKEAFLVGGISMAPCSIAIFGTALAAGLVTLWAIETTRLGPAMRGCAQDAEVSSLLGVDPR